MIKKDFIQDLIINTKFHCAPRYCRTDFLSAPRCFGFLLSFSIIPLGHWVIKSLTPLPLRRYRMYLGMFVSLGILVSRQVVIPPLSPCCDLLSPKRNSAIRVALKRGKTESLGSDTGAVMSQAAVTEAIGKNVKARVMPLQNCYMNDNSFTINIGRVLVTYSNEKVGVAFDINQSYTIPHTCGLCFNLTENTFYVRIQEQIHIDDVLLLYRHEILGIIGNAEWMGCLWHEQRLKQIEDDPSLTWEVGTFYVENNEDGKPAGSEDDTVKCVWRSGFIRDTGFILTPKEGYGIKYFTFNEDGTYHSFSMRADKWEGQEYQSPGDGKFIRLIVKKLDNSFISKEEARQSFYFKSILHVVPSTDILFKVRMMNGGISGNGNPWSLASSKQMQNEDLYFWSVHSSCELIKVSKGDVLRINYSSAGINKEEFEIGWIALDKEGLYHYSSIDELQQNFANINWCEDDTDVRVEEDGYLRITVSAKSTARLKEDWDLKLSFAVYNAGNEVVLSKDVVSSYLNFKKEYTYPYVKDISYPIRDVKGIAFDNPESLDYVRSEIGYNNGYIIFPKEYTPYGRPLPLILYIHGSVGVTFTNIKNPTYLSFLKNVAAGGYIVADCSALSSFYYKKRWRNFNKCSRL